MDSVWGSRLAPRGRIIPAKGVSPGQDPVGTLPPASAGLGSRAGPRPGLTPFAGINRPVGPPPGEDIDSWIRYGSRLAPRGRIISAKGVSPGQDPVGTLPPASAGLGSRAGPRPGLTPFAGINRPVGPPPGGRERMLGFRVWLRLAPRGRIIPAKGVSPGQDPVGTLPHRRSDRRKQKEPARHSSPAPEYHFVSRTES